MLKGLGNEEIHHVKKAYGPIVSFGVALCTSMGLGGHAAGADFDLSDPAWSINKTETALVHTRSGMHFQKTLGAFELEKNIVHDNQGKSVSVIYLGGDGDTQVHAKISVQTDEIRTLEQLFKVSSVAFGLRYGNVKPYKVANIKIPTKRGKLPGKAAAYFIEPKGQPVQTDTRLYLFKLGRNVIKVQTRHPMSFPRGSAMIHNDLLKELDWASLKR